MPTTVSSAHFLTILRPWGAVSEPTYKRMGQLLDVDPGHEVLWIGTGSARSVMWWAERFKTHIVGLDPESDSVEVAEAAARAAGFANQIAFQVAPAHDLPYEEDVFDLVVINALSLLGHDYKAIIREAGRVARPGASVVALVPSWQREADPADAALLSQRLRFTPQLVVEWRRWFREGQIGDLAVEDVAPNSHWIETHFVGLIVRGWRVARWRGIRFVLSDGVRTLRQLVHQRVLGLSIIKGTR